MIQKSKILHLSQEGDLILLGTSRKQSNLWASAGIISGNNILHSFPADGISLTVKQSLAHFLEHESKPIGLFRIHDSKMKSELQAMVNAIEKSLSKEQGWFKRLFSKKAPTFSKENTVNLSNVILEHFNVRHLNDIERLGLFVRLL